MRTCVCACVRACVRACMCARACMHTHVYFSCTTVVLLNPPDDFRGYIFRINACQRIQIYVHIYINKSPAVVLPGG